MILVLAFSQLQLEIATAQSFNLPHNLYLDIHSQLPSYSPVYL